MVGTLPSSGSQQSRIPWTLRSGPCLEAFCLSILNPNCSRENAEGNGLHTRLYMLAWGEAEVQKVVRGPFDAPNGFLSSLDNNVSI